MRHRTLGGMDDLKVQMLKALRSNDRAAGERIRALQIEEAIKQHLDHIELINSAFYQAWCDWDALEEIKNIREKIKENHVRLNRFNQE